LAGWVDPLPALTAPLRSPPNQRADLLLQSASQGEGEWKLGMKRETEKSLDEQRRIIDYLDGLQAKVNALPALRSSGRLQSVSGEELSAPMKII
jgi:hypothetical protein